MHAFKYQVELRNGCFSFANNGIDLDKIVAAVGDSVVTIRIVPKDTEPPEVNADADRQTEGA